MKVKKFTSKTMPEAMQQVRKELGSDAVILQSKEVKKGGILGLFKNKRIEVVAALDDVQKEKPIQAKESIQRKESIQPSVIPKRNSTDAAVLNEIKYLKELIEKQTWTSKRNWPPLYELTHHYLLKQELEEELADQLMDEVMETYGAEEITSKQEMKAILETMLMEKLADIPFKGIENDKQIIHFVGPTGVGKTTTLAKVAAKSILEDKKKVALITMDTYRIAAIDQLKTYARILDVPLEVAYSLDDYQQALQMFRDYDFIFVDTAGRNFRYPQYVKELKETIEIEQMHVDTFLVLALTLKTQDINDIYRQFEPLDLQSVIFTKLDETSTYGSMFNMSLREKKQIMYVTNGQNVPDDLLEPTKEQMVNLLLSRYENG